MPYYDKFDIIEAHYCWNADHHSGQWSPEYLRLCKISQYYSPGPMVNGPDSENAAAIYDNLCIKNDCQHKGA